MRVGLFGGAFDPIHEGHIRLAEHVLREASLDRIIFMPGGVSPHKGRLKASPNDRYNMAVLAVSGNPRFSVSDMEIKKESPSYTIETVTELLRENPEYELFFIMGDDEYAIFDRWYKKDELLTLCTFLVVTRSGIDIKPPFVHIPMEKIPVSSTEIRAGEKEFLNPYVAKYIKERNLYGK